MIFELRTSSRNVSDAELLRDIRRTAKKLGKKSMSAAEYNSNGKYKSHLAYRRFGGWSNALVKAGLKVHKNNNITIEELFKNLEVVWIALGRQPYCTEMCKPLSKYAASVYTNRFGSWHNAMAAFVKYINQSGKNLKYKKLKRMEKKFTHKKRKKRAVTNSMRFVIMQRDNFKCRLCGRSPATDPKIKLEIDHIKPWSKGGETVPENLQTLCRKCNNGKSDKSN